MDTGTYSLSIQYQYRSVYPYEYMLYGIIHTGSWSEGTPDRSTRSFLGYCKKIFIVFCACSNQYFTYDTAHVDTDWVDQSITMH